MTLFQHPTLGVTLKSLGSVEGLMYRTNHGRIAPRLETRPCTLSKFVSRDCATRFFRFCVGVERTWRLS